ncbi:MAG: hypothetical protein ABI426_03370 [Flavobacterium sp.]
MNSIIRYVFAREIYRTYSENRDEIAHHLTLKNIWNFILSAFVVIVIISFSFSFSKRNDLSIFQLEKNDSIYVNNWKSFSFDEIPVYQMASEKNEYSTDTIKKDTIVSYNLSQKVDSTFQFKKAIGIFNGFAIKNSDKEDLIGFTRTSNLKLTKPNMTDFSYDEKNKYSDNLYIPIEDIKKIDTKEPESRWFQHFIYMTIAFFSFKKLIISLFRLLKRKVPIYERVPVYKRDNRYSSGKRIVRYNSVIKEYRKFTDEELELHKKQQFSRILFNGITLTISIGLLFYLYISKN